MMKKSLLVFSMLVFASTSFAQILYDNYIITFDNSNDLHHLSFDTTANHTNIWQIGSPQKSIFKSAYSFPNVLATGLQNSYPVNDTSSFTIANVEYSGGFEHQHTVHLFGKYYVNSDTLTDYGKFEFSPDNGNTWIDLLKDTIYSSYVYWDNIPVFSGNSNGWQSFVINLANLGYVLNIDYGDTVLYRFTFISDSVQTNKDGLMFDDFYFEDYYEGIEEFRNENSVFIYPNPVTNQLTVHRNKNADKPSIQIINYTGQVVYSDPHFIDEKIDVSQLPKGVYLLNYSDAKTSSVIKFVVSN